MLAVRWRPWRHLELELALAGGSAKAAQDGATESSRDVSEAVLGLRWRFNPQKKWNFWAMAGLGTLTIAPQGATKDERNALQQSTLQFGGGLERRWSRFAIDAELRAVGVAPIQNKDDGNAPPMTTVATSPGATPPPPSTTSTTVDGWKGLQLLISGNFYF